MNNAAQLVQYFKNGLHDKGYKATPQRVKVFEALLQEGSTTNVMLADRLLDSVDRATTYRTIELLESLGLITRIWNGWKSSIELSDAFVAHHHHATCKQCGKTLRIESAQLEEVLSAIAATLSFDMKDHILELSGYCSECRG